MKKIIVLIAVATLFLACDALIDNIDGDNGPITPPESISFSNPKIGQTSTYIGVRIEEYFSMTPTCQEYSDTLVVTVIDIEGDTIQMMQKFRILHTFGKSTSGEYDTTTFSVVISNDSISIIYPLSIIAGPSVVGPSITWGYYSSLPKQTTTNNLTYKSCIPKISCSCQSEDMLPTLVVDDKTYNTVNMFVDNESMQVDGPGYTFLYSMDDGIIYSYLINPWTDAGEAWKRIN